MKKKLVKLGLAVGALALCWLLKSAGLINGENAPQNGADKGPVAQPAAEAPAPPATPPSTPKAVEQKPATPPPAPKAVAQKPAAPAADDGIAQDGEYYDKKNVAAYIRKFKGKLPKNYITKAKARSLGWQGGPVEPFAPGKAIGGDWFGNYEHRLPEGTYRECDIDTRGKPRGVKRLIYTPHGQKIYYTGDHYETFEEVVAR